MNRDPRLPSPPDLDARIDRLVAGDLADADRRILLGQIENSPDGWRRCALAFLEDQAWRTALMELAPTATTGPSILAASMPAPRPRPVRGAARLALAAGLAAIALGSSFWLGATFPRRPDPAVVAPLIELAGPPAPPPSAVEGDDEAPPGQPLGWVGLVQQTDGASEVRPIPYLAPTPANAAWVASQPPTLPDYVRAQIERQGYQVEETHRLVDVNLQDGRRVAIPVDEVAVDYVGRVPL